MAHNHITYIAKNDFLLAFKAAYNKAFIENNIRAGFRGAEIIPFNPNIVILKLNIRLRTPILLVQQCTVWKPKTPHNAYKMEAQLTLVCDKIRNHYGSPASSIDKKVA